MTRQELDEIVHGRRIAAERTKREKREKAEREKAEKAAKKARAKEEAEVDKELAALKKRIGK